MIEFLNGLKESIIIIDEASCIVFINTSCSRRTGYSLEEIKGRHVLQWLFLCKQYLEIRTQAGLKIRGEYTLDKISFEQAPHQIFTITWQDIENTKTSHLVNLLNALDQGVCIRDISGKYTFVNEHCMRVTGATHTRLLELLDEDAHQNKEATLANGDEEIILKKQPLVYETYTQYGGVSFYLKVRKIPLLNSKGEIQGIGSIVEELEIDKIVREKIGVALASLGSELKLTQYITHYRSKVFNQIKEILKQYLGATQAEIYVYLQERGVLVNPTFAKGEEEISLEKLAAHCGILINEREIAHYQTNNFDKIKFFNSEKSRYYEVKYPLFYQEHFVGLLIFKFDDFPALQIINSDAVHQVCEHIAFSIQYLRLVESLQQKAQHNKALSKELEKYLDAVSDFIVKVDAEGNFRYVAKGCTEVLGWSRSQLMQFRWQELIHPDDLESTTEYMKKIYALRAAKVEIRKNKEKCINRYLCADGSYKWLCWDTHPEYDPDLKGLVIAMAQDITSEMQIEENENFLKQVQQTEELSSHFFANLTHELRTPLTLMLSSIKYLKQEVNLDPIIEERHEGFQKYMHILQQNTYRLWRLVTNLIDVSKIDEGIYQIYKSNENIVYLVEEIISEATPYFHQRKIDVLFDTEQEEIIIACDSHQIERVILNLLSNALKHTPEEGRIHVNIKVRDKEVIISIENTGAAISKDKLKFIFQKFIQTENILSRPHEGSGLGLYLVKALIELHEGKIEVESMENKGTIFTVRLPYKKLEEKEKRVNRRIYHPSQKEKCFIEFSDLPRS
jgi:PAS domain S-box-containing protein